MKRIFVFLGFAILFSFGSCKKKAADMIIGHWEISRCENSYGRPDFHESAVWEFYADGTFRFEANDGIRMGDYMVNGSNIYLSCCSPQNGRIVNMNGNGMVWLMEDGSRIHFQRTDQSIDNSYDGVEYYIDAEPSPLEGGFVYGRGYYYEYDYCLLEANANSGFVFSNWTEDGEVVSYDEYYSFTVERSRHLVANFISTAPVYEIFATAKPAGGGTIYGDGKYKEYDECTLRAVPSPDHVFLDWTEDGEVVSNEEYYLFPVTRDRHLVANFLAFVPSQTLHFECNGHVFEYGETIEASYDENIGEWAKNIQIRNTADYSQSVVIEKQVIHQDHEDAFDYFCWGFCYSPQVMVSRPVEMGANEVSGENDLSFHAYVPYGGVLVKYCAYNVNHPYERASIIVSFNYY